MSNHASLDLDLGLLEGRSFVIGREGHIYVDSLMASKRHAKITVIRGRIYLRDLGSTNGTFLKKGDMVLMFEEGYVSALQSVLIGERWYKIVDLLKTAREFSAIDDAVTEISIPEQAANQG